MKNMILLLALLVPSVLGFADWMTKDFCERPLAAGEIIMNQVVVLNSERNVKVFRDDKELQSGDQYFQGETLTVTIEDGPVGNQHVFECTPNAQFEKGGCKGTRSSKTSVKITMPNPPVDPVNIWAGWATGHAEVQLTPTFSLYSIPKEITSNNVAESDKDASALLNVNDTTRTLKGLLEKKKNALDPKIAKLDLKKAKLNTIANNKKTMSKLMENGREDFPEAPSSQGTVKRSVKYPIDKDTLRLALRGHEAYLAPGIERSKTHYFMIIFFGGVAIGLVFVFKYLLAQRFKINRQLLKMRGYEVDK